MEIDSRAVKTLQVSQRMEKETGNEQEKEGMEEEVVERKEVLREKVW